MRFAVGLDLHGTLMEDREYIRPELLEPLLAALSAARRNCRLFVCTGNDLTFVKRKIPADVLALFDGFVLEMGAVLSAGDDERVMVGAATISAIKALEGRLRAYGDPEVHKFDRRLAAIAIFTKYGVSPADYQRVIEGRVRSLGYGGLVYVTYSSVAVDIVPRGFSKLTGLMAVAAGLETVGVADSMNDAQMLIGSDWSFCPSNIAPGLGESLARGGKVLAGLSESTELLPGVTYVSEYPATAGVIEILSRLARL